MAKPYTRTTAHGQRKHRKHWTQTAEGRRKMSQIQRTRWAKRKGNRILGLNDETNLENMLTRDQVAPEKLVGSHAQVAPRLEPELEKRAFAMRDQIESLAFSIGLTTLYAVVKDAYENQVALAGV